MKTKPKLVDLVEEEEEEVVVAVGVIGEEAEAVGGEVVGLEVGNAVGVEIIGDDGSLVVRDGFRPCVFW